MSSGGGAPARMYISRIRVENIRGFSGTRNVDLTLTRPDGSHAGWTVSLGGTVGEIVSASGDRARSELGLR